MKWLVAGASLLGASCICIGCIARGARVRTPKGSRPIEELQVGDEVSCVDPATGRFEVGKVLAIRSLRRECVQLDGLLATSDHPLYCPATGEWAPAGDWAVGKRTQLLRVGDESVAPVAVERVSTFAGVHEVFDLTVDHPLHNFVAEGVLVHNKSPPSESCPGPDGGMTFEGTNCTCPDGTLSFTVCSAGVATCANCRPVTGGDGGTDGGSDGGDGG